MCGFAGEYLTDAQEQVDAASLRRRVERMQHRGPDALGFWLDHHVGFAHARLSLLDFASGDQPMRSPRGTVLSYNGEIYNGNELRAELSVRGWTFRTRSDTEVLLAAYETWGTRAWERLNGMFAFALYDPQSDRLYLVRDRLGIKPLFYRTTARGTEFGSEPSAWEHLSDNATSINPSLVLQYLRFAQPVLGTQTVFTDLQVLEPGTQLVVDTHGATVERWFSPSAKFAPNEDGASVIRARLRHLLHSAIGRQMVADAPVGVFLSGGIDSAILVGLLSQMRDDPPATFTIALSGDEEELRPAAAVAARWNCNHHEAIVSPAEFFSAMRDLIGKRHLPAAYPNEVLIYLLAQRASSEVKAVLTGEGADELFGGYTRILSTLDIYMKAQDAAKKGDPMMLDLLRMEYPQLDSGSDSRFFAGIYSWFQYSELDGLLKDKWREALRQLDHSDPFADMLKEFHAISPGNRFHWLLEYAHLPNLLARLDGATMGASLEGRVPYTDTNLVDYVTSLQPEWKYAPHCPDKPLLRGMFDDFLPREVAERPKRAFNASLDKLFQSSEGCVEIGKVCSTDAMSEIFNLSALRAWMNGNRSAGFGQKCWLLLSLNMWLNRNIL
ncbi:asparagine synthase (glutamine-hydrolyzing) [candidate division KSB1 bacterium]|nr:MAG: asparagine synthase (glutamine-hydrolyzing) [candidate division KSB1 bacterium]